MSGGVSSMDIRLPMGLMFTIIGAIIAVYGFVDPSHSLSLGINVNLWWGIVMTIFGIVMLAFAIAAGKKKPGT